MGRRFSINNRCKIKIFDLLISQFILRSIVEVGNLTLESKGDKELAMTASLTCLGQHIIMNE